MSHLVSCLDWTFVVLALLENSKFTSIGSHNIDGDENSENKDHYSQTIPWLDQQARHFTDEQDEYHNESDESDGR